MKDNLQPYTVSWCKIRNIFLVGLGVRSLFASVVVVCCNHQKNKIEIVTTEKSSFVRCLWIFFIILPQFCSSFWCLIVLLLWLAELKVNRYACILSNTKSICKTAYVGSIGVLCSIDLGCWKFALGWLSNA